jgi:hypothetical protein
MALTRAQLLSGNNSFGITLPGQTQGVTQGTGVTIAANGQISFDSATAVGIMRLNNPGAYNAYVWPGIDGAAGDQLTTDGAGNLVWAASGTPTYTAKGQIEVATGVGTSALQAVGTNTSFLVADSSATTGVKWSSSSTSAALAPAGNGTTDRPSPSVAGQFRYNTVTQKFEFSDGTNWQEIASGDPTVNTFVKQTVPSAPAGATGNAVIPAGTTLQRQTAPAVTVGQLRYNTTDNEFEGYGGSPAAWGPLGGVPTGAAGDKIFFLNSQVITANYTLPTVPLAKNSVTAGPITINVGVTVTVPAGQSWSIV